MATGFQFLASSATIFTTREIFIYDEGNLRRDLALQHEATIAAVRLFHFLSANNDEDVVADSEE